MSDKTKDVKVDKEKLSKSLKAKKKAIDNNKIITK
jgi:hypothetical protein